MSRKAKNEYIGVKRRAYAHADDKKRSRMLDEVCETTNLSRDYVGRLLNGSRVFRDHKGRGRKYNDAVVETLKRVWREAVCPCLPYFKVEVERWVEEYSTQVAYIKPEIKALLVEMSDRTMSRYLAGEKRIKRIQAAYTQAKHEGEDLARYADSPCPTISRRNERPESGQYLANQKPPHYLENGLFN